MSLRIAERKNLEINYPAVMRTLLEAGYEGYVGLEFIPTRNPAEGLAEAVWCMIRLVGRTQIGVVWWT